MEGNVAKGIPIKYKEKVIKGIDGKIGIKIDRKIRARPSGGSIITLPNFLKNKEVTLVIIEKGIEEVNVFK